MQSMTERPEHSFVCSRIQEDTSSSPNTRNRDGQIKKKYTAGVQFGNGTWHARTVIVIGQLRHVAEHNVAILAIREIVLRQVGATDNDLREMME